MTTAMDDGSLASTFPPGPILMVTKGVDVLCNIPPFECSEWRSYVPFGWASPPHGWFSHHVGDVSAMLPDLLTYDDYTASTGSPKWSVQSMYDFAFHTPSTVLADLTTPTATLILLILVLFLRILKSYLLPYFSSIGRRAGRRTHGLLWEKHNEERIVKFGEYVFRLLYHSIVSLYGIWYFYDKEWWDPSRGGTRNLYWNYPNQDIQVGMIWYYLVQSAYNAEALVSLFKLSFDCHVRSPIRCMDRQQTNNNKNNNKLKNGNENGNLKLNANKKNIFVLQSPLDIAWSKTVRGDFREMLVHHIVTNLLIIGSSFFRFTRPGSMIFLVHDISDVPVDLSKLANFLKWKRATACGFFLMVLLWLIMRLIILPFVIYKSMLTESHLLVTQPNATLDAIMYYTYRHFFYVLTALIIMLHLAWFGMFLRMGYLLVWKGETHDLSEHKNGEQQHHPHRYVAGVENGNVNGDCVSGGTGSRVNNGTSSHYQNDNNYQHQNGNGSGKNGIFEEKKKDE